MSLERLVQIQSIDVEIKQLRHRRKTLEQRDLLEDAHKERASKQEAIDEVAALRVEAASRQRRLEHEAQTVADKAAADEKRLYSGEVGGMKDLQALQTEIAHLKQRQDSIEDDELEAMEQAEALRATVEEMETACSDLDRLIEDLTRDIAEVEQDIDSHLSALETQRGEIAPEIPQAMLVEYEQLRPNFGSATIVKFNGKNCVGCPSMMPSMEVDRLKHAEANTLEHCTECGRMVVN